MDQKIEVMAQVIETDENLRIWEIDGIVVHARRHKMKDATDQTLYWLTDENSVKIEKGDVLKIRGRISNGTEYPIIQQWEYNHGKIPGIQKMEFHI